MLTEPMTPVLLRMTGPMILGIVAILAFNLVDTFFIGMLGTQALAAISMEMPTATHARGRVFVFKRFILGLEKRHACPRQTAGTHHSAIRKESGEAWFMLPPDMTSLEDTESRLSMN